MTKQTNLIASLLLFGFVGISQQECRKPACVQGWTQWFDRDGPYGSGDWETLSSLRKENPGKICPYPTSIEARTISGINVEYTGERIFKYDTTFGFVCRNEDQNNGQCQDYRVRFSCTFNTCEKVCWTKWYNRDDPKGSGDWEDLTSLREENRDGNLCAKPIYVEAVTVDGLVPAHMTGQKFYFYCPREGFACRHEDQTFGKCKNYKVRFGCICRSVV